MPVPSLFQPFIETLERLELPYCITGSVASSIYGEPRLTAGIDIVLLLLRGGDIHRFMLAFPEETFYIPPAETIGVEAYRTSRGMFKVIHHATQFKADFYLAAEDPLQHWALQHRRRFDLDGDGIWVVPPEYVIIRKLEFLKEGHSDKHVRDIRYILAATPVDQHYLSQEVMQRVLQTEWDRCRST